ncbi:MAG TPA: DEAD/DEAH box helicase [Chthonomonadaceae bacterium]|nr:DEAD/DEAH box helicase [Chthonomonadaceae bacterium]
MNFDGYLHDLKRAEFYKGQIAHVERIPARQARYGALERPLHSSLDAKLRELGVRRLYAHQAEAVNAARDGEHVTVVTATASGKTLCYNLPVLDAVLSDSRARAFYLFPTKALAQDQLGKLNDFGLFPTVRFATYDGDTPAADRRFIKKGAHIVLTNPDMLHVGILPYHTTWSGFLANLKYVVVDEMHTYRGVFGAHVAHILRRLRRACAFYGADPQFLCCSATIANPEELTRRLTGVDGPIVVNENGAPSGPRTFVFWNPPLVDLEQGQRRSAHVEATALFTDLVTQGVRNITFTKARKSAELILRYARSDFEQRAPDLVPRIMSYRAGYTPQERRKIEQGLFTGKLIGVTATNALELGVDVGGLDATVLTGYPGTIASTWQQAGRAGRGGDEALSVLVAFDNPLDQFLMRHPDYFFGRPHERAIVDPDNRRILAQHLLCAAYERALSPEDLPRFGPNARIALETLTEQNKLLWRGGRWRFTGGDYPAAGVNIRSASDSSFKIVDEEHGSRLVGTVEGNVAYSTIHPGAIYLHQGETYLVTRLDIANQTAFVRPAEANYYTEARENSHILILDTKQSRDLGHTKAFFGEVVVTKQVVGYRRKRLFSDEVLEVVDLDLPEQTFETEAFWFTVPNAILRTLVTEGGDLGGSIHAIEHAAIGMMPLLSTCDRWDVGGVSHPAHPDTDLPTIFIYDGYPGGVGIAEATYATLDELLRATQEIIADCPCADGCPSCVQSPKCGNNNIPLDKNGARRLLELLAPLPDPLPKNRGRERSKR